jgi:hypothetical protein
MKIDLEILVRAAWVVVAFAAVAPFILGRVKGDGALLRLLRSKAQPILPIDHSELKDQMGAGVRVSLFLTIPIVIAYAYFQGRGWGLVIILLGAVVVPMVTIPLALAHTVLIRFLSYRGPFVSVAAGLVVGAIAGRIVASGEYARPFIIYGAVYGLIIGLGRTKLAAPGLVPEKVTDPPHEAPFC